MTATRNAATGELGICKRCSTNAATLKIRQDSLCTECFIKYVTTKIVKRMETFRVRNLPQGHIRKLLLPLSLGISSACLLHVLSEHLEGQLKKSGRPGYSLHVVHVLSEEQAQGDRVLASFRIRYPHHEYSVSTLIPKPQHPSGEGHGAGSELQSDFDLSALFSSVTSPSSRSDLSSVGLRRRLVAEAHRLGCEGILWGDSTTSLAEKILSETAKGRGSSLPWLTADGGSPMGVPLYFPMKDLLRKELPAFARAVGILPDLVGLDGGVQSTPVSARNNTIDGLMKDYFESLEESYPSIVANVVRTSGKLSVPKVPNDIARCDVCSLPTTDQSANAIDPENDAAGKGSSSAGRILCYGCKTTLGVYG